MDIPTRIQALSPRKIYVFVLGMAGLCLLIYATHLNHGRFSMSLRVLQPPSGGKRLSIADQIYVISLPERQDRWTDMERLRLALDADWTYFDALTAGDLLVGAILGWVHFLRSDNFRNSNGSGTVSVTRNATFSWPEDIESRVHSGEWLELWHTSPWPPPFKFSILSPNISMSSAANNFYFPNVSMSVPPPHMILTPARVACWYSHLSVIHQVANSNLTSEVGTTVILEDDIDMESDIEMQLNLLWPMLPDDWDIVFLGHCWSKEDHFLPLEPNSTSSNSSRCKLHPSKRPKCTHAYALSPTGARRLLLHLQYPPFAFSRAIDQAIAWLVENGRLKSFSVVPSLVVQRKISRSDVMQGDGTGSGWKDHLIHGVLGDDNVT